MRREPAYLLDMLNAARDILAFTEGFTFDDFRANKLVQSAVIREILVLGEAARHVSTPTQTAAPDIDWALIVGMRNRLVHAYFAIDLEIVWKAVQQDIPPLIGRLEQLLPPQE